MFVTRDKTRLLFRQKFCRDKHTFVASRDVFCPDKIFAATKTTLVAAPANDRSPWSGSGQRRMRGESRPGVKAVALTLAAGNADVYDALDARGECQGPAGISVFSWPLPASSFTPPSSPSQYGLAELWRCLSPATARATRTSQGLIIIIIIMIIIIIIIIMNT